MGPSAKSLRIVLMGTGAFAVPMSRALLESRHEVLAVVTQPRRAARGGRKPPDSPMRALAVERGLPLFDPESINTDESRAALTAWSPDIFVVADYGQILRPETLAVAPRGGINLHGSVLPKYRGAAPVNWAIYHGDAETGVTVIHMTPQVDAGPCIAVLQTPIFQDENAVELEHRLADLGAPLVVESVDRLADGDVRPLAQDPQQASPARRLRKSDGEIDWSRSARQIRNQIRALEPWPRTSTWWHRAGAEPLRVILGRSQVEHAISPTAQPGEIVEAAQDRLIVATGGDWLRIDELQTPGKRMMAVGEFLRGHGVQPGQRLGPGPEDPPSRE